MRLLRCLLVGVVSGCVGQAGPVPDAADSGLSPDAGLSLDAGPSPDAGQTPGDAGLHGSLWVPRVDGNGRVLDSDLLMLPLNAWVEVGTNTLSDVIGPEGYPTKLGNTDGRNSIIGAWSGAGWDWIHQRMFISGGGHADSHLCENGIYAFDGETLRFSVAVPRSPKSAALKQNMQGQFEVIARDDDPRQESANAPMADGHVGATHTYDTIDYVPPALMSNTRGGLVMFSSSVHVYDLDTATSDVPFYDATVNGNIDLSYKISFMDGWQLFHARASFYYRQWDLRPVTRTATQWSNAYGNGSLSRGAMVGSFSSGANFVYNHKSMAKLWQRREVVVLSASSKIRVRYGDAVDARNVADWAAYTDQITLTSTDGSHADFDVAAAYRDDEGGQPGARAASAVRPISAVLTTVPLVACKCSIEPARRSCFECRPFGGSPS